MIVSFCIFSTCNISCKTSLCYTIECGAFNNEVHHLLQTLVDDMQSCEFDQENATITDCTGFLKSLSFEAYCICCDIPKFELWDNLFFTINISADTRNSYKL